MKDFSLPYPKKQLFPLFFSIGLFLFLTSPFNFINGQGFFDAPVADPYDIGIAAVPFSDMPFVSLIDLDNDGDLDLFNSRLSISPGFTCWNHVSLDYYENQGTEGCPEFVFIGAEPFGLPVDVRYPTFVDIDGDGDLDLFSSTFCATTSFFFCENIGTPEVPLFDGEELIYNPFGTNPATIAFAHLQFYDMDADGDFDAFINGQKDPSFRYQENIGTATTPDFGPVQIDPFGLQIPGEYAPDWGVCVDWDCDGDLDILNAHSPANSIISWDLYYYENIGSPSQPLFDEPYFTGDHMTPMGIDDLDADGDLDLLYNEFYYENKSQASSCVTPPQVNYVYMPVGLMVEFTDESTTKATACRPVEWFWSFGDGDSSEEQHPNHTYSTAGIYTVCLTVEDVTGNSTNCQDIDLLSSGLNDLSFDNYLTLYPNPASNFLFLELKEGIKVENWNVEIINSLGQRVNNKLYNLDIFGTTNGRLDITPLPTGVYFLKLNNRAQTLSAQFVKM